jgi:hypothetical protein
MTEPAAGRRGSPTFQLQEQVMTTDLADAARTLIQVTQAARVFDRLVDSLIERLRGDAHAAPVSCEVRLRQDGTLEIADAELVAMRERMDALYPEFQGLYGNLLLKHLGAEHVDEVVGVLRSEPMQRYFRARRQMEQALVEGMSTLGQKLSDAMYQSQAA